MQLLIETMISSDKSQHSIFNIQVVTSSTVQLGCIQDYLTAEASTENRKDLFLESVVGNSS
jgi:hypothetical protein